MRTYSRPGPSSDKAMHPAEGKAKEGRKEAEKTGADKRKQKGKAGE